MTPNTPTQEDHTMPQPAQHTPGPWKLVPSTNPVQGISGRVDIIAPMAFGEGAAPLYLATVFVGRDKELEANATLMAEAPALLAERDRLKALNAELLYAVETALCRLTGGNEGRGGATTDECLCRDYRELIAKAKGAA